MARVRQPEAEIRPPLRRRQVVSVRIARDPGAKDQYRLATQAAFGHLVITKSGQEAPKRNGKSCAEKCLRVVKRGSPPNVDKRRREAESLWALIVFVGCPKGFQQPPNSRMAAPLGKLRAVRRALWPPQVSMVGMESRLPTTSRGQEWVFGGNL